MKNKGYLNMTKKIFKLVTAFFLLAVMPAFSYALEPKLLWEKKLDFEVNDYAVAEESGDIIICAKYAGKFMVFNKDGKTRYEWGPRVDRKPISVGISNDGSRFVYSSAWTEGFATKKQKQGIHGWDGRTHYLDSTGRELWNVKSEYSITRISPDGSLVAVTGIPGESGGLVVYDGTGEAILVGDVGGAGSLFFLSNGKYILTDEDKFIYLFDKDKILWKKEFSREISSLRSIDNSGTYMATGLFEGMHRFGNNGEIAYINGETIKSGAYDAHVSLDGSKGYVIDSEGFKVYSIPEGKLLRNSPLTFPTDNDGYGISYDVSSDWRYIVLAEDNKKGEGNTSFTIVDTIGKKTIKKTLPGENLVVNFLLGGKYLFVLSGKPEPESKASLYLYELGD